MPKNFKPAMGKGDLGFTDLFGGRRISKTDRRIKLNALLDDLGALLGLLKAGIKAAGIKKELTAAQKSLVAAAGIVAGTGAGLEPDIRVLENHIAAAAAKIKTPKKFVLPGANETEALAHYARAKARLCEISAWEIKAKAPAVYLNRLSDLLFLVALREK